MINDSDNQVSLSSIDDTKTNTNNQVPSISLNVDCKKSEKQTVFSFHNISYTVKTKKNICGICRSKNSKQILYDIR